MSKRKVFLSITACILVSVFSFNTCCYGLATAPASQNSIVRREVLAALERTNIRIAKSAEELRLLSANDDAAALLLSSGKKLISGNIFDNDLKLLRAIWHEEIEAILQIMAKEDRSKYQGMKELVLNYFPPVKNNKLPVELYVNHNIALAFEWMLMEYAGIPIDNEISPEEEGFLKAIRPIIMSNKTSYFTSEFWDPGLRREKIRRAINDGMVFYQTADSRGDEKQIKHFFTLRDALLGQLSAAAGIAFDAGINMDPAKRTDWIKRVIKCSASVPADSYLRGQFLFYLASGIVKHADILQNPEELLRETIKAAGASTSYYSRDDVLYRIALYACEQKRFVEEALMAVGLTGNEHDISLYEKSKVPVKIFIQPYCYGDLENRIKKILTDTLHEADESEYTAYAVYAISSIGSVMAERKELVEEAQGAFKLAVKKANLSKGSERVMLLGHIASIMYSYEELRRSGRGLFDFAVSEAHKIKDANEREVGLSYLAYYMAKHKDLIGEAESIAVSLKSKTWHDSALEKIILEMVENKDLIDRAIALANSIEDIDSRESKLAIIASRIAEDAEFINKAIAIVKSINRGIFSRNGAVSKIIPNALQDRSSIFEVMELIKLIRDDDAKKVEALRHFATAVAGYSDLIAEEKALLRAAAEIADSMSDNISSAKAITYIASGMAQQKNLENEAKVLFDKAFSKAQLIEGPWFKAPVLRVIASEMVKHAYLRDQAEAVLMMAIDSADSGREIDGREDLGENAESRSVALYEIGFKMADFLKDEGADRIQGFLEDATQGAISTNGGVRAADKFKRRIRKKMDELNGEPGYLATEIAGIASKMAKAGLVSEARVEFEHAIDIVRKNAEDLERSYRSEGRKIDWLDTGDDEFLEENNPWRLLNEIAVKMGRCEAFKEEAIELARTIDDPFQRKIALKMLGERGLVEADKLDIAYDTNFTTILTMDLAYAQFQDDRVYEIKYDKSRLSLSQVAIIEAYVKLLQARTSGQDNVRLRPFSSEQGSAESLIAVYCTGKNFKGEGHVDVSIPDGDLKDYLLRITGMVNIAVASSNIPDDLSREDIDKYRPILSYINNQYKAILGESLAIPESPEDILKVIRRIVLGLPKSLRSDFSHIEEYNRLAKQALAAA
ncbi:MAG: hypothetical protein WCY36_00575 [Candidatus Omnitrophota bacterium]